MRNGELQEYTCFCNGVEAIPSLLCRRYSDNKLTLSQQVIYLCFAVKYDKINDDIIIVNAYE